MSVAADVDVSVLIISDKAMAIVEVPRVNDPAPLTLIGVPPTGFDAFESNEIKVRDLPPGNYEIFAMPPRFGSYTYRDLDAAGEPEIHVKAEQISEFTLSAGQNLNLGTLPYESVQLRKITDLRLKMRELAQPDDKSPDFQP